jgi:hypothetical protein
MSPQALEKRGWRLMILANEKSTIGVHQSSIEACFMVRGCVYRSWRACG